MSSYIAVADAIKIVFTTALAADPAVSVWRGVRLDRINEDYVAIGGIDTGSHIFATFKSGRKKRDESYLLVVNISAVRYEESPESAEERVMDLMTTVTSAMADDPTLGLGPAGTGTMNTLRVIAGEYELESVAHDHGWRTLLVLKIQVDNRVN